MTGKSTMWGKEVLDKNVWDAAVERVEYAYGLFDTLSVAFSGGKDSTCVLQVAIEATRRLGRPPLRVIFWDEEAIPYETEAYVRRINEQYGPEGEGVIRLEWYCIPVQHRNACSPKAPYWWCWDPDHRDRWVRPLPPEAITELEGFEVQPPGARRSIPNCDELTFRFERDGMVGSMLGIRSQESLMRQRMVRAREVDNWIIPRLRHVKKLYPVYDWGYHDVWRAIREFGWDYNEAYDVMEMAGIQGPDQRCAPPYGEQPLLGLWQFHVCFPDIWDRMCERVPGAAAAARYARTEVYGLVGRQMPKPADLPWPEWISRLIERWENENGARDFVARDVQKNLHMHYRNTPDPVLVYTPHPNGGITWRHLQALVTKGNFKGRATPNFAGYDDGPRRERYRAYLEEFDFWLEQERLWELGLPEDARPCDPEPWMVEERERHYRLRDRGETGTFVEPQLEEDTAEVLT